MINEQIVVNLPDDEEICPFPPFIRKRRPTIQVLGVENIVWDWDNRNIKGNCTHRNCRSKVHFFAQKPLGHIFFFDIDNKDPDIIEKIREIVFFHDFSHFILTETIKGFHIWICEIRSQKMDYYPLFMNLKRQFNSDYEFHGQWVLRLGPRESSFPPVYCYHEINEDKKGDVFISLAHLNLLVKFAEMPKLVNLDLTFFDLYSSFARQVLYRSWTVERGDSL